MNYLENFTQKITDSGIEEEPAIVQYCKVLAAMIPSSLFVLDMVQKRLLQGILLNLICLEVKNQGL